MNKMPINTLFPDATDSLRKKRLGQYFTGNKLAKLLAILSDTNPNASIIDPMCGVGDMIAAFPDSNSNKAGIEIDSSAYGILQENFAGYQNQPTLILGNAFGLSVIKKLPEKEYDLVITNPPYVRYQSLSKEGEIPNSDSIRHGLFDIISDSKNLTETETYLFKTITKGYSGLSDLAVPSWILCALLTKKGGKLAMVLPESWLSRDYAHIIQYLLLRCFKVHYIIEDANAVWFKDAQVKTNLLIAERKPEKQSAFASNNDGYLHVKLYRTSLNENSVVGNIFPNSIAPENLFNDSLKKIVATKADCENQFYSAHWVSNDSVSQNLKNLVLKKSWLTKLEKGIVLTSNTSFDHEAFIPNELRALLNKDSRKKFTNLPKLKINVGQGIRTGANTFFYLDFIKSDGDCSKVQTSKIYGKKIIEVSNDCLLPVLRKQSELPEGFTLNLENVKGRVLFLEKFALPEDISNVRNEIMKQYYQVPSNDLIEYIRKAKSIKVGPTESQKFIPELSAVRTNNRKEDSLKSPRFWYMLPAIAPRHRPDIFLARINGSTLRAYLNKNRDSLIDANFSSIWIDNETKYINKYSVLALFNSSWVSVNLELMASVMGGGALKIEATHLRKIPIPVFNEETWEILTVLGRKLMSENSLTILNEIDESIARFIFNSDNVHSEIEKINTIKTHRALMRSKNN